jgi:predicted Fe-Mo cluster-binding NifX family protein
LGIAVYKRRFIMIVCITAKGGTLDSEFDARFGRGEFFIFYDTETKIYKALKNPNVDEAGGAGTKSAQLVSINGTKILISGHLGANADIAVKAAGIEFVSETGGTVKEIIQKHFK